VPGVLESVLMMDDLTTEIIGDGIHVGSRLVEFVHRVKGGDRTALVSDALRGVGCGPGDYAFGPRNGQLCRIVEDPLVGVVPDRPGILASSAITLSDSLRILSKGTALPLDELWKMASSVPARIVRLDDRKGSLAPGHDADILALDEGLNVSRVFARGEEAKESLCSI
jgi:N-acetylglucosamine-6-phosphate deacetylase